MAVPRAVPGLAAAGLAVGLPLVPIGLATDDVAPAGIWAVFGPLIGWSFIGAGLYALARPPSRRFGTLMVATGFLWFLGGLSLLDEPLLWALGLPLGSLWAGTLVHALLAFPTGLLPSRHARAVVAGFYVAFVASWVPLLLVTPDPARLISCETCPENPLAIADSDAAADALYAARNLLIVVVFGALCVLLARRWRRASPLQRRALAPILSTSLVIAVEGVLIGAVGAVGWTRASNALTWAAFATVAVVPVAFLAGLARSHVYRTGAVARLVEGLGGRLDAADLRAALARALDDPTLELAFWLPEERGYVDAHGRPVELPAADSGRAVTPIEHDGRPVAALLHDGALRDEPELVSGVGAAASLALQNERLEAELNRRLDELRSSRSHLVAAGDAERRRLERDLHDGAQQRFVALGLRLRLARNQLVDDAPPAALLDTAIEELAAGLKELRELARGIHPAILTDGGLHAALRGLVTRAPLPVTLLEVPDDRLPAPVETAAYFVVAEALTNVAKYAHATAATVRVARTDGNAFVEVHDDGVGGADETTGSGLRGLSERVAALDGELELDSPAGRGTTLRARLPCGSAQARR
jgi:signal transduction histidine kinase